MIELSRKFRHILISKHSIQIIKKVYNKANIIQEVDKCLEKLELLAWVMLAQRWLMA